MTVRLVKCNHLDLRLFQFDYDLTFAVFFLNPDRTIYARYGTRSSHDGDKDVSLEGLAATMRAVLDLHREYPTDRKRLAGKQPAEPMRPVPEEFESLSHFGAKLDYRGQVAKSCIHCHQIRDAQRVEFRTARKPIPDKLIYPFPSLTLFGIQLDKKSRASIGMIDRDSIADRAGLQPGDSIAMVNGCGIASEADIDWLLHNLETKKESDAILNMQIERDGEVLTVPLELPRGWREKTSIDWRPTTWSLRRMATGGMTLKALSNEDRKQLSIPQGSMALRADHVGRYGLHARARRAGIREQDVIVTFGGRTDLMTESQLIQFALQEKQINDEVSIVYLRNGKRRTAKIQLK